LAADSDPCEDCRERALMAARIEISNALTIVNAAMLALVVLALIRGGVLSPADLLPVPRG
jgi:hypothetical protein